MLARFQSAAGISLGDCSRNELRKSRRHSSSSRGRLVLVLAPELVIVPSSRRHRSLPGQCGVALLARLPICAAPFFLNFTNFMNCAQVVEWLAACVSRLQMLDGRPTAQGLFAFSIHFFSMCPYLRFFLFDISLFFSFFFQTLSAREVTENPSDAKKFKKKNF